MAARLHGLHWRSEGLRALPWLRESGWLSAAGAGAGEEPEEPANLRFAQQHAARAWAGTVAKMGEGGVRWSPFMVELVGASLERVSWSAYRERVGAEAFTLVHGDFHPANM
ncbi:hypothetical protein B484DRAFT_399918, partial [Ochromonadaceae sp. CCMP2298]